VGAERAAITIVSRDRGVAETILQALPEGGKRNQGRNEHIFGHLLIHPLSEQLLSGSAAVIFDPVKDVTGCTQKNALIGDKLALGGEMAESVETIPVLTFFHTLEVAVVIGHPLIETHLPEIIPVLAIGYHKQPRLDCGVGAADGQIVIPEYLPHFKHHLAGGR
jgi:hypothetical protein